VIDKTKLLIPFLLFSFWGCQEKYPVYSSFCDSDSREFPRCLNYSIFDQNISRRVESSFGIEDDKSCSYRVELTQYHVGKCDNPIIKSMGSDFNGYVRIEIKKGFKCYYKVQSDFKNDSDLALDRVLEKIKEEI